MANRPQVPGWTNINKNKPEEYSSEFSYQNYRFANVTNVNTGQKQLYFVSGLTGTIFTNRTLLLTTNSDGTNIKSADYQTFVDRFGSSILIQAANVNRNQSCSIVKKASTEEEKNSLSKTKEYKSCISSSTTNNPNNQNTSSSSPPRTPSSGGGILTYPLDIANTNQDRIKFVACEISSRAGGILGLPKYDPKEDPVYITIQSPISDQNGVTWGEDKINAVEAAAFNVAEAAINPNDSGTSQLQKEFTNLINESKSKTAQGAAALAAGNPNLFTRATQQVLNPNLELLFREPQLRPFSFTFLMSARSEEEAKVIKRIIKFFKKNMAPRTVGGGLFLKAPYTFFIDYLEGNSKTQKSINLIAPEKQQTKACALTDMRVDYTPMGTYMTFDDEEKTMVAYRMQLQFKEINPVYREDYEQGEGANHPIGY